MTKKEERLNQITEDLGRIDSALHKEILNAGTGMYASRSVLSLATAKIAYEMEKQKLEKDTEK